jgi:hypothetical protein
MYEKFQPTTETQDAELDTLRIVREAGISALSAAFKTSANADDIFGSVSFVSTDAPPAQPETVDANPERTKIEELQKQYGIHVIRILTPSSTEYGVYQNDKLQFTTRNADLEAELKKNGMHPLKELSFDKDSRLDDFFVYVQRNYGLRSIQFTTASKTTYAFYNEKDELVSSGSLKDLADKIDKGEVPRQFKPASPEKQNASAKVITHLPNGQTAVEYGDGSEVRLNKDKEVISFSSSREFSIKPANRERTLWSTSEGGTVKGKYSFLPDGSIKFETLDEKSGLAERVYDGKAGVSDTFKDGTRVSYVQGIAKRIVSPDGTTVAIDGSSELTISRKDGKKWNVKVEKNGGLTPKTEADALTQDDELRLQALLGDAYAKMGLMPQALKHHQVVLDALEQKYTPGSSEPVKQHMRIAELKQLNRDSKGAEWHTREIQEIKRVSDYMHRVAGAPDDLARAFVVADALPSNIKLDTTGKTIRLDLTDAGKALEAIPGLRLPGTRNTSDLKALSLNGNKFTIEGNGSFKFKIPNTEFYSDINLKNANCDITADPSDPTKVKLSNFRGLSIQVLGANFQPEHITLSAVRNADGSECLKLEFGKLVPAIGADGKPDLIAGLVAARVPEVAPVEIGVPKEVRIDRLMEQVSAWSKAGDKKDAGKMFEAIVGLYANTDISNVFKDITQMKKTGSKIEIDLNAKGDYSIGGLPIVGNAKVSTELVRDGGKVTLKNIEGAKTKFPLPDDVANGLGLKNPIAIAIKEISLGEPDKAGNRVATIKTDSVLESVSLKVGPNFEPLRDEKGNISVEAKLKSGDSVATVKLLANPDQLAKADPTNIDFSVHVTGGSDQVAKIAQGFIGHELDPTVAELLNGIESVTKKGDQITITRKAASTHDKGGLKVNVAKTVGFKIDPKAANLELRDISGIDIVDLPDVAGKIYAHKMPVSIRYVSLSNADQNGERVFTMKADGVVSSATLQLDASMNPKQIVAVVENPAKYLKESLGNRDQVARRLDMLTKGKSYRITIAGNGAVDLDGLGGVGGVADMLLNGGDLVSLTGAASTVVGYVGTNITRGSAEANRGLAQKVEEAWNYLFK